MATETLGLIFCMILILFAGASVGYSLISYGRHIREPEVHKEIEYKGIKIRYGSLGITGNEKIWFASIEGSGFGHLKLDYVKEWIDNELIERSINNVKEKK